MADLISSSKSYQNLLAHLKSQIRTAQVRAAVALMAAGAKSNQTAESKALDIDVILAARVQWRETADGLTWVADRRSCVHVIVNAVRRGRAPRADRTRIQTFSHAGTRIRRSRTSKSERSMRASRRR